MRGAAAALCLALACGGAHGLDDSADERFLAGLRERSLFELAEAYCAERLADPNLPDKRRAELVIELSLALSEWAVNSPPDRREPLWQRATEVVDNYVRQHADSPWLIQVRLQAALGILARGELARQESELVAGKEKLTEEARSHLRAAIMQLEGLLEEVQAAQRRFSMPGRAGSGERGLTERELESLEHNLQYQLARAYRNQGRSYPPSSADRAHAMTRAIEMLGPLASLETDHPLAWPSRIDEIVCYRLLEDAAMARRRIQSLFEEEPPPPVALRGRSEQLLLSLAAEKWSDVGAVMDQGRTVENATSAELDYAWLKAYLEGWRGAEKTGDSDRAEESRKRASDMIQLMQRLYGPYWVRRGQMLMSAYVQQSPGSSDMEMWAQAAENSFHSGRYDDALAAYDRAGALAEAQGHSDRAFELGLAAAAIEDRRSRHGQAMTRYRDLALAIPAHPKAPEAHLQAVFHAAQAARGGSSESLSRYVALLQEHLRTWPEKSTADQARCWLGRLRQTERDWQDAIAAYRGISIDYPEYGEVVRAAGRCYESWLDELKSAGEPTGRIASAASEWFESLIVMPDGRLPDRFSPLQRDVALAAARLRLEYTEDGFAAAEGILRSALQGSSDASPDWTAAARAMLVFSLAEQGKYAEAAAELDGISAGPPGQLLRMLEGLSRIGAGAGDQVKASLAGLQLRAIELLWPRRGDLQPADQQVLDRVHARALADAGRRDEALDAYRWLATTYPRDGDIQEAYAQLLSEAEDRPSLETALAKWRDVAEGSRTASDRWFRAKYAIALLNYRLGQPEQAATVIRQLSILHPEMGGLEMKRRFMELLDRCRAPGRGAPRE